ncbi:uncharacterized protein [Periplaneta americana]|uniref:uncharacterized protein n=1 Tax=Periplaneta americana TaxID=6978 RepID=UPI0037E83950
MNKRVKEALFVLALLLSLKVSTEEDKEEHGIMVHGFVPDKAIDNMIVLKKLKIKKLGRTSFKISGNAQFKRDLPRDATAEVKIYMCRSDTTRDLIDLKVDLPRRNLCEWIENDKQFWPQVVKKSTLPAKCSINKGVYKMDGVDLTLNEISINATLEHYKVALLVKDGNKDFYGVSVYVELK